MQEPFENEECPVGSSWKILKQSCNPLEFGSSPTTSKQYNPGKVRNFPLNFRATSRKKLSTKVYLAKKFLCKTTPSLYAFCCRAKLAIMRLSKHMSLPTCHIWESWRFNFIKWTKGVGGVRLSNSNTASCI